MNREKMKRIKNVTENKDPKIFDKVQCLQNQLNSVIENNKQNYYSHLLKSWQIQWLVQNPIGQVWTCFWRIKNFFVFLPKSPKWKIEYVTDFKEKAEIFNSFAEVSSLLNDSRKLPPTFLKMPEKVYLINII